MDDKRRVSLSKLLSLVLRHRPERVGIRLDAHGWVDVDSLLDALRNDGTAISKEDLDEVVATSSKQRFAFSPDGTRIRANQGHSVDVDLAYEPRSPPGRLFHGTPTHRVAAIRASGLLKMQRHHVHLSSDAQTAAAVGARRGRAVVLTVDAQRMATDGHVFYCSTNGVWLVDAVPPRYIDFSDRGAYEGTGN